MTICKCCGKAFKPNHFRRYCSDECRNKRVCKKCGRKHNHKERNQISDFCLACHPAAIRIEDYIPKNDKGKFVWLLDIEKDEWLKQRIET